MNGSRGAPCRGTQPSRGGRSRRGRCRLNWVKADKSGHDWSRSKGVPTNPINISMRAKKSRGRVSSGRSRAAYAQPPGVPEGCGRRVRFDRPKKAVKTGHAPTPRSGSHLVLREGKNDGTHPDLLPFDPVPRLFSSGGLSFRPGFPVGPARDALRAGAEGGGRRAAVAATAE